MSEVQLYEINQLKTEVIILANQMATNILEIGKRLLAIREMVEHGQWNTWVEQNLPFSRRWANQYIRAYKEFGNSSSQLPAKKMFLLLDLPAEQREDFIKDNPIEEMTTRELQKAIKEKKALEEENRQLKNRKPEVVVKEVPTLPEEYHRMKRELREGKSEIERLTAELGVMERQAKLNDKDAKEYARLKEQISFLTKRKDNLSRQIESATELSGLVVRVENFLKTELAPIKYSRAIHEARADEIVTENLRDIVDRVQDWCNEMYQYLPTENIVEAEVIDSEYRADEFAE